MQAIQEIYKIGAGPSSSHTLACERACKLFIKEYGKLAHYEVELYGSLSLTGKGHWTDTIIKETLTFASCQVHFKLNWAEKFPNGFYLQGYDQKRQPIAKWTVFSLGGGTIDIKEFPLNFNQEIYPQKNFAEIKEYLLHHKCSLVEYALAYEPNLREHMQKILEAMLTSVNNGLHNEGLLPGKLKIKRVAKDLYADARKINLESERRNLLLYSYAYSANEENACRQQVVTAPTLGACGVLAAIIKYCAHNLNIPKAKLIDSLIIAGIFGNIIKQNASISGAMGGCQAEIGSACAMAAAALAFINDLSLSQIEYSAEIGIEHNLGLTCDPVGGYVIIPCIERNAMGAVRAYDAMVLAKHMGRIRSNLISFDTIVETMAYTGQKMAVELKETSIGGLAKEFHFPLED